MSITATFDFDSETGYDLTNTEISDGSGRLATHAAAKSFNQDFSSSSGFTFDPAFAEFTGGLVRQKATRPASATFGANYTVDANGTFGGGVLTATVNSPATVNGGYLKLVGANAYVNYAGAGNSNFGPTGAIRFRVTPQYSGTPGVLQIFCTLSAANASLGNYAVVYHDNTNGNLALQVYNSGGAPLLSLSTLWVPVSGTEYEIEVDIDVVGGATRMFVDGVQLGATDTSTGTRTTTMDKFVLGANYDNSSATNNNFWLRDVEIFNAVQHTADYTPGYTIYQYVYMPSEVELPEFEYEGPIQINSLTSLLTTDLNAPRYTVQGKYFNGSLWVTSDGTFAQASTAAQVTANLPALTLSTGTTSIVMSVVFQDSNSVQQSCSDLTLGYLGVFYFTTGTIETVTSLSVEEALAFTADVIVPTDTQIGFVMSLDGVLKYWDGAAWANSDGTIEQSNSAVVVNTNITTLLPVDSNAGVKILVVFQTDDDAASASISEMTFTYDFGGAQPHPALCLVWGYVLNISGAPIPNATVSAVLQRNANEYKEADGTIISKPVSVKTQTDGYFEIYLVRSSSYEGTGIYAFSVTYPNDPPQSITKSSTGQPILITVPDADEKNITDLITAA